MMTDETLDWNGLKARAATKLGQLIAGKPVETQTAYQQLFKIEINELEKQCATSYYLRSYNEGVKYATNKNGLVIPWALGMTTVDPLTSKHDWIKQTDLPDVDLDLLPKVREKVKAYIAEKYGHDRVCSVGAMQTYKFKMALQDAARGLGERCPGGTKEARALATTLPDDVDELKDGGYAKCTKCETPHNEITCPKCGCPDTEGVTIGKILKDYDNLRAYAETHQEVLELAVGLMGKVRQLGKHAGGLIIADCPLLGAVPMAKDAKSRAEGKSTGTANWSSLWTEGRNTQLSKLGYTKWDLLGLTTLQYIHECCKLVERTRGHRFSTVPWTDLNPREDCLGIYWDENGELQSVSMSDPEVFRMFNELRVETVFQFETNIQKDVLKNGVRDFYDLQTLNSMGHPGSIAFIPEYIKRRDDREKTWLKDEHPEIAEMLKETLGLLVYQEDLAAAWMKFANFTAPETEAARKAVAKKWVHKLKPIQEMWIKGATKTIGAEWAEKMWGRMVTFGRYAFNKCIDGAEILVDPSTGERTTVGDLYHNPRPFNLQSYDIDADQVVNDEVIEVVDSGSQEVFEVELDNGVKLNLSINHRLQCDDGLYHTIDEIHEHHYRIIVPGHDVRKEEG